MFRLNKTGMNAVKAFLREIGTDGVRANLETGIYTWASEIDDAKNAGNSTFEIAAQYTGSGRIEELWIDENPEWFDVEEEESEDEDD